MKNVPAVLGFVVGLAVVGLNVGEKVNPATVGVNEGFDVVGFSVIGVFVAGDTVDKCRSAFISNTQTKK